MISPQGPEGLVEIFLPEICKEKERPPKVPQTNGFSNFLASLVAKSECVPEYKVPR